MTKKEYIKGQVNNCRRAAWAAKRLEDASYWTKKGQAYEVMIDDDGRDLSFDEWHREIGLNIKVEIIT